MRSATIILLFSLALTCVACKAIVPVSQQDLDDMAGMQESFTQASVTAASQGNEVGSAIYAGLGGLASVLLTVGLSRKRRAEAALEVATGNKKIPSLVGPAALGKPAT